MNLRTAIQIKRLQENLVSREGLIKTLKAENLRLNRETAGVRRVLKVPLSASVQQSARKKLVIKKKVIAKKK
jgi:hypothetical protein